MTGGRSNKDRGSRVEREVAAMFGAKRTPLSGAAGGADLTFPTDSIYSGMAVEVKARKVIPKFLLDAIAQAAWATQTSAKIPAMVLKTDRQEPHIFMSLRHFVEFTSALAEMGQGSRVKSLARQAKRVIEEIERTT